MFEDLDRHPAVQNIVRWFDYSHLQEGSDARYISKKFTELVEELLDDINDSPELAVGLRKLLEAKDACVRAIIEDNE